MISKRTNAACGSNGNGQRGLLAHAAMVKRCFSENKHYLLQTSAPSRQHQAMLDSDEIKRRFGRALKANPGLQLKDIAEFCDVTPQAVGDWKRTGRIDKRHFQKLSEITHTSLSYWLEEHGVHTASDDRTTSKAVANSPERTEMELVVGLMAQSLAASTPIAGRELVKALRDKVGLAPHTFANELVKLLESQLSDLADTFPRKHSVRGSRG